MEEVVFFHRKTRTLILADYIQNFEAEKVGGFFYVWLLRLAGVEDPDGKTPRSQADVLGPQEGGPRLLGEDARLAAREGDHGPRATLLPRRHGRTASRVRLARLEGVAGRKGSVFSDVKGTLLYPTSQLLMTPCTRRVRRKSLLHALR